MKSLHDLLSYDVVLIDGMNTATIEFFSKKGLSYRGEPTGMLYGVCRKINQLFRYASRRSPIYWLWEGFGSVRKAKYPTYKANRDKSMYFDTHGFKQGLLDIRTALSLIKGIHQLTHDKLEADDLAGYLTEQAISQGKSVLLVSTDTDWYQFVKSEQVHVMKRNDILTPEDLRKSLGHEPANVLVYKMLRGDSTDNIKPIPRFPSFLAKRIAQNISIQVSDNIDSLFLALLDADYTGFLRWKDLVGQHRELLYMNYYLIKSHNEIVSVDHLKQNRVVGCANKSHWLSFCQNRGLKSIESVFYS